MPQSPNTSSLTLVLFRHAQKGINPINDPSLTDEGHLQAEEILKFVQKNQLPQPTHCWISPKIRTYETLKPCCEYFNIKATLNESLDLRKNHEGASDFQKRISIFINSIEERLPQISHSTNEVHFVCTHYDWIEESMTLINSDKDLNTFEFSHWSPAQFIVFKIEPNQWRFIKKGVTHAPNKN